MSNKKVLSPVELYDKKGVMEDFVLDAVNALLAKKRPDSPCGFLTLDRSQIKSTLKEAANHHKAEYKKSWITLLPIYLAAAGWSVEVTSWGYRLLPQNLSIESGGSYGGANEEE